MGNCFKTPSTDDISLLRGNESQDGSDQSLGPPPPYQVSVYIFLFVYFSFIDFISEVPVLYLLKK